MLNEQCNNWQVILQPNSIWKRKKTLNRTRQENDNKKEHKSKSIDILGVWSIRFDFKWHNEIGGKTTWLKQTRTKNSAKQH